MRKSRHMRWGNPAANSDRVPVHFWRHRRLSSVGQSDALVMRRSRVRFPEAAPPRGTSTPFAGADAVPVLRILIVFFRSFHPFSRRVAHAGRNPYAWGGTPA